jgi:hypothetical protein
MICRHIRVSKQTIETTCIRGHSNQVNIAQTVPERFKQLETCPPIVETTIHPGSAIDSYLGSRYKPLHEKESRRASDPPAAQVQIHAIEVGRLALVLPKWALINQDPCCLATHPVELGNSC